MTTALTVIAVAVFVPFVIVWGLWLVAVVAAVPRAGVPEPPDGVLPRIDVLIPAHDEEGLLPALLDALGRDRAALGRVVVVADHCTDGTAEVARRAGATVVVRDGAPRGKPAAVRDGLAAIAAMPDPGAGVLILDADCVPSEGFVRWMAARLRAGDAVAQSAYLMRQPEGDAASAGVHLGILLKNVVRPTGQARLGLPCQLLGTGMLLRSDVLTAVSFRDDLVEDVRLSHDLILAGVRPRFVPEAEVVSSLPVGRAALTQQRMRWEGGQMSALRTGIALAARRLRRGDVRSALALIDWSAPPLALAVAAWTVATVATGILVAVDAVPPWALAPPLIAAAILVAYLGLGVTVAAGPRAVLRLAASAPRFLAWKVGVYLRLAVGAAPRTWTRTPRETDAGGQEGS